MRLWRRGLEGAVSHRADPAIALCWKKSPTKLSLSSTFSNHSFPLARPDQKATRLQQSLRRNRLLPFAAVKNFPVIKSLGTKPVLEVRHCCTVTHHHRTAIHLPLLRQTARHQPRCRRAGKLARLLRFSWAAKSNRGRTPDAPVEKSTPHLH